MRKWQREGLKMAEAEHSQNPPKIGCRSKRSVCNIFEIINKRALSVVQDFKELSEEEQNRIIQRFKEIYETALYQNVLIDGQNVCDLKALESEETTEYEPVDLDKKKYINETMMAKLDDAIVLTSQKRKHCPVKYKNRLKRITNKSVSHLAHLRVQSNSSLENKTTENGIGLLSTSQLQSKIKDTESTLSFTSKATSKMLSKAEELKTCAKIQDMNKNYMSKYSDTAVDDEVTPSTKRKRKQQVPTSPKKLRQSPRLFQKYSSHKPRLKLK